MTNEIGRWVGKVLTGVACAILMQATWAVATPQGTLIVLNKSDDTAQLIDLSSGKTVRKLTTGFQPHEVAVTPGGRSAIVSNYGDRSNPGSSLTVLDLVNHSVSGSINLHPYQRPHGVQFLDADRFLVTAEAQQALLLVHLASGRIERSFNTDAKISHMVAATKDAKRAFVTSIGSGNLTVFDLTDGRTLGQLDTGTGAEGVAVTPDDAQVWITNRGKNTITVLDREHLKVKATLPCGRFPIRVTFTVDGHHALVSNAKSGDVALFDVRQRKEIHRFSLGGIKAVQDREGRLFKDVFGQSPVPIGVLAHPGGRYAYVAATNADVIVELDLKERRIGRQFKAGHQPDGLGFVP